MTLMRLVPVRTLSAVLRGEPRNRLMGIHSLYQGVAAKKTTQEVVPTFLGGGSEAGLSPNFDWAGHWAGKSRDLAYSVGV
jgi:hypothetical protein